MATSKEKEPVVRSGTQPNPASKPTASLTTRIISVLPPWASQNLRSVRSWKTLARCWVATWASLIVILPTKSLTALGNTAFFCLLVSLMMPPNLPVQMFFFIIAMIVSGQLLGWALGAAVMAAAVAARDQVLLRSSYEAAQQTAATAANPDAAFKLEIFQGVFLDARSSIVYGVMFAVFSFMFAVGRAYRPRLVLFFTFSQIFLDIFCTLGPLFPNTQYTILSSILISTSTYMAIGLVCCVLIFPETMNHSYLDLTEKLLGDMKTYYAMYDSVLELTPDEIADDTSGIIGRCVKQRLGMIMTMQGLQQKGGLINVEFSWGRWSGNDAVKLEDPLRSLIARMGGFYNFHKLLGRQAGQSLSRSSTKSGDKSDDTMVSDIHAAEEIAGDTELIRQLNSRRHALESENNVRLADIMPLLLNSTADIRGACQNALGAAQEMIRQANRGRWSRGSKAHTEKESGLDAAIERLRASADAYKSKGRLEILEPFLPLLQAADQDGSTRKQLPLRPLIIASAFASQIIVTVDGLIDLLEVIQGTVHKRQKARLWAPSGLRSLGNFILRREKETSAETSLVLGENTVIEVEDEEKKEEAPYRRDPDSKPPTNAVQKIMNSVHRIYIWTKTPQAIFATKYAILSVLLWLPSVIRSSANFFYVQKGIWALIMAQTSLNVYASDSIYSLVTRCLGTFVGLIIGLIVWYIGNGSGNGNPFGISASYGVFVIPVLFVRCFAPPIYLQPVIMCCATLALITGYSWIDSHLPTIASPGVGWPIAWKRFTLVIIGSAAAAIMMMIPPVSGRKAVRLQNATFISELSSLYSSLMSVWITEEETITYNNDHQNGQAHADGGDNETGKVGKSGPPSIAPTVKRGWVAPLRKRVLLLSGQLQAVQGQIGMAKLEGSIRGAWPAEEYTKMLEYEADTLAALGQLSSALQHLDPTWRASLNRKTMILNPNFITDVMSTFALVSQSLRTGEPMHQILPTSLLDRLLYHHTHDVLMRRDQRLPENISFVERTSSIEFTYFATGVTAVFQVIKSLDEMHRITRRLCGEVPFRGFSEWKNDYDHAFGST